MRAIRLILITLASIIALLALAVVLLTVLIDPNDYKGEIESLAKEKGGINLNIDGDIGWSLYPWLGLSIGETAVKTQDNQDFTKIQSLQAKVSLASLFDMKPQVQKLVLDGLSLNLHKDATGKANWENISSKKSEGDSAEKSAEPEEEKPSTSDKDAQPLAFAVEEVAITNLKVNYRDEQANQAFVLDPLNIVAKNISLQDAFPLSIDFNLEDKANALSINSDINTNILLGKNFETVEIQSLKADTKLSGKPFNGNTVSSTLSGDIKANLVDQVFTLSNMVSTIANLTVEYNLSANTSGKQPKIEGQIKLPAFSPKTLLNQLGQPAIATTDPKVLEKVSLSANISSPDNQLVIDLAELFLDDTKFNGKVVQQVDSGHLDANFKGDAIDVDRYLPPKQLTERELALQSLKADAEVIKEGKERPVDALVAADRAKQTISQELDRKAPENTAPVQAAPTDENAPLLAAESLKNLSLNATFDLAKLTIQKLPIENIAIKASAKDGLIQLEKADGELFEGNFKANASLDARTDTILWKAHQEINNIQSHPLIKTLAELGILSGGINFKADFNSQGNSIAELKKATKGQANFFLKQGAIEGVNLTKKVCEGIASVSGKSTKGINWEERTPFTDLSGNIDIKGLNLSNPSLVGNLAGIKLTGKGDVSVENQMLDYQVALTMVGDEAIKACNINKKFKDIPWPIRCKGSFDTPPAQLCKPDLKAFGRAVEKLAKKEVKRKVNKEVDKLLDKHSDKIDGPTKDVINDLRKRFKF